MPALHDERRPKTITQFCDFYGLSRPTFYGMVRRKQAPKILQVGERGRLITPEDEDEWRKAHTHDAHEICQSGELSSDNQS